jgi:hypothetical protein
MTRGHCICGAVEYELSFEIERMSNCHCQFCRRAHGAAFVTSALVPTAALDIKSGLEALVRHEGRYFCGTCGTRLFNRSDEFPGATTLMVSSLEEQPTVEPAMHMNVESKAPWYRIRDDHPQFEAFPPGVQRQLTSFDRDSDS